MNDIDKIYACAAIFLAYVALVILTMTEVPCIVVMCIISKCRKKFGADLALPLVTE